MKKVPKNLHISKKSANLALDLDAKEKEYPEVLMWLRKKRRPTMSAIAQLTGASLSTIKRLKKEFNL